MVIHLLLHVDGVVQRFGRVVPDAVALLSAVDDLRGRLLRAPQSMAIEVHGVRLAPESEDADRQLKAVLDASGRSFDAGHRHIVPEIDSLPAILRAGSPVLLTTNRHLYRQAWAADIDVCLVVGPESPQPTRSIAYDDVPRMLEEKLRIPTARPMSRVARTGGLLAIACDDPIDAHRRALDALARDPRADWTILGSTLILYTEDPDYEDRLAAQDQVERLSYGVNKGHLRVERRSDVDALIVVDGWALIEGPPGSTIEVSALGWQSVRRRVCSAPATRERRPSIEDLLDRPATRPAREAYAERLATDPRQDWVVVEEIVGPAACFDILAENSETIAVAWQSPARGHDVDNLLTVYVHTVDAELTVGTSSPVLATALALWRTLDESAESSAALHCVRRSTVATVAAVLEGFLSPGERLTAKVIRVDSASASG